MKNIIKNISCWMLALSSLAVVAQESSTSAAALGRISINAYIPPQRDALPSGAENMLTNKLNQILTANGISGSNPRPKFIIVPSIVVTSKDITATAPPMTALSLDVNFYVGDGVEGKLYASKSVSVKGVGANETKAYLDALKNIKANDPGMQSFLSGAKTKIIDYYNARCTQIINEANSMANSLMDYDGALGKLTSVPEECTECYNKAMAAAAPMFRKKIERDCKKIMVEANNLWNANQDWDTANQVGQLLSSVDPEASCYKDAKALSDKIGKRVLEIDKREWNYKMEVDVNLKRDMIKAIRDIGVAYGNGQPKTVVYKSFW
ncbi:MAG: hypothetical protein U0X58_04540 [Flavobacteriaceae bacterium]